MTRDTTKCLTPTGEKRTPVTRMIIVAIISTGLIQACSANHLSNWILEPAELGRRPWNLLTYAFIHVNVAHLIFNLLALTFLTQIEKDHGGGKALGLFALGSLAGGIAHTLTSDQPIAGASAGIMAAVTVGLLQRPHNKVFLFFLPVKAWVACGFAVLASLVGIVIPYGHIAHMGHLGGILVGAIAFLLLPQPPNIEEPTTPVAIDTRTQNNLEYPVAKIWLMTMVIVDGTQGIVYCFAGHPVPVTPYFPQVVVGFWTILGCFYYLLTFLLSVSQNYKSPAICLLSWTFVGQLLIKPETFRTLDIPISWAIILWTTIQLYKTNPRYQISFKNCRT